MTETIAVPIVDDGPRLAAIVPATIATQVVVAVVVGALAATRADDASLSPVAFVGVTVGVAMTSALLAWIAGLYEGAARVLDGSVPLRCSASCPATESPDLLEGAGLRRSATRLTLVVGVWALAGSGLMAVVLDNRPARAAVIIVGLIGIAAASAAVVDGAARHRGAHVATRLVAEPPTPVGLRTRAWRQIALPLAAAQVLVNAGAAWLLFHDDVVGNALASHALTRSSALGDVPVMLTLLAVLFAGTYGRAWGAIDARLGRITLDDPDTQRVRRTEAFGVQGVIYVALLGYGLAQLFGYVVPATPQLWQVMVVRGLYAGVLVGAFCAVGYVRGAANEMSEEPA